LNYSDVETSGTPYYEEPQPQQPQEQEQEQRREIPNTPSNIGRVEGAIIAPKSRRPKNQASTSTEITSEIADPPQLSPGKMIALMALKKAEEFNKKNQLVEEEAKIRAQQEKERILELSRIARKIQEKLNNYRNRKMERRIRKKRTGNTSKRPREKTKKEKEIVEIIEERKILNE
jgi:hypothetical protein